MTISGVLIVKNEEVMLPKCLDSIKGVDELIIVDTGSEDKTVEIAKKYTDKIYHFKWCDSFCKARNFANSKATGDWILTIDADEQLQNPVSEIKKYLETFKGDLVNVITVDQASGLRNYFPRLFKRQPDIFWKGDIHNHLSKATTENSPFTIVYGHSPAHKKDPDRALRILTRVVKENPKCIRERYYLAREYWYRKQYKKCIAELNSYLKVATWRAEIAEAYLMKSKCLWKIQKGEEARIACMYAIMTNPDFKEALLCMSEMNYEPRKSKWLQFAELAKNKDVLFIQDNTEKSSSYYDNLFEKDSNMFRYENIYEKIGSLVGDKGVLDIGCGLAELSKYIKNYSGFDFSKRAVELANNPNIWVGDAYDRKNYKKADIYTATEVLEHLDDMKVINNLPRGSRFIFSVPSFADPSHLRVYTEEIVRSRPLYINKIYRYNWHNNKWVEGGKETPSYILLVDSNIVDNNPVI
jgi:glycosyltransferase involved in cell wall biosynthesis